MRRRALLHVSLQFQYPTILNPEPQTLSPYTLNTQNRTAKLRRPRRAPQAAEVTESMTPQMASPAVTPPSLPAQAANAKMHSLPYSEDMSQSVSPAPYALHTCARADSGSQGARWCDGAQWSGCTLAQRAQRCDLGVFVFLLSTLMLSALASPMTPSTHNPTRNLIAWRHDA